MTTSQNVSQQRLLFIDVLRLVAAVQMIQGHAIAAVLAPSHRTGPVFATWTFARGLTSVMFLFSAGFSLALAEARRADPVSRQRRAWRALRLLALGYALHAPLALAWGAPSGPTLRAFFAVDVLQCIAVSLLSLELLATRLPRASQRTWLAATGALVLLSSGPIGHSGLFDALPLGLRDYLSARDGSLFPVLPWAGFMWAGFAVASSFRAAAGPLAGRLAWLGLLIGASGVIACLLEPSWPRAVSPGYALVKLGCVLALSALLARLLRHVTALPWWLAALAGETLFLYASHVLLLYADGVGLVTVLGNAHSAWFGAALALALLLVCSLGALGLRSLRRRSASGTRAAHIP